jgi:hypothetical protein
VSGVGHPVGRAAILANRAFIAAHLGDAEAVRRDAAESSRLAAASGALMAERTVAWSLGLLELSLDDPAAAHRHLAPLVEAARAAWDRQSPARFASSPTTSRHWSAPAGSTGRGALLRWFAALAAAADRVHATAAADRCRGLLLAARGDPLAPSEALAASGPNTPRSRIRSAKRGRSSPSARHCAEPATVATPGDAEAALAAFAALAPPGGRMRHGGGRRRSAVARRAGTS